MKGGVMKILLSSIDNISSDGDAITIELISNDTIRIPSKYVNKDVKMTVVEYGVDYVKEFLEITFTSY